MDSRYIGSFIIRYMIVNNKISINNSYYIKNTEDIFCIFFRRLGMPEQNDLSALYKIKTMKYDKYLVLSNNGWKYESNHYLNDINLLWHIKEINIRKYSLDNIKLVNKDSTIFINAYVDDINWLN